MKECQKCQIDEEHAKLYEVISPTGIEFFCRKCLVGVNYPQVKHKLELEEEKPENPELFTERKVESDFDKRVGEATRRTSLALPQKGSQEEVKLRDLVDQSYKAAESKSTNKREDLIENFHWIIMRTRRKKCVSQEQMAQDLAEPLNAITMVEKGVLPEKDYELLRKIEIYLGVKLIKGDTLEKIKETFVDEKGLNLDPVATQNITISDLREIQQRKAEDERKLSYSLETDDGGKIEITKKQPSEEKNNKSDFYKKAKLSQEEINKMLFGEE